RRNVRVVERKEAIRAPAGGIRPQPRATRRDRSEKSSDEAAGLRLRAGVHKTPRRPDRAPGLSDRVAAIIKSLREGKLRDAQPELAKPLLTRRDRPDAKAEVAEGCKPVILSRRSDEKALSSQ